MARKWSNLNLPGALHYITGNFLDRTPVFSDPEWVKAGLVRSAKDYYWSGFRSFCSQGNEPSAVDHDWWWPEDSEKQSKAMKEMGWYSFEKRR